jgi:hypothetical protein
MSVLIEQRLNLFTLQKTLWMLTKPIGIPVYDFKFEQFFECKHHWQHPDSVTAIARLGAIENYGEFYETLASEGIQLIHTLDEHLKCSELTNWYPLLADITPKSVWFSEPPTISQIENDFKFPIFLKGSRQTSQHKKALSIIDSPQALSEALQLYTQDPILHWQPLVVREYIKLRPVLGGEPDKIPASFEFRTFWWKGKFVGAGQYWFQAEPYQWTAKEEQEAIALAQKAAAKLSVPFLVVDIAQQINGEWIVIECNDGQESGYAGLAPFPLWKNILAVEQKNSDS